jgi:hypothetical protein
LQNLGKNMPETEIRKDLEALHVQVQAVMQLRSRRRDQDAEKDRPLTPHLIASVARGPDVAKVRSLAELCDLRIKVETYKLQKNLYNANADNASGTRKVTAVIVRVIYFGALTFSLLPTHILGIQIVLRGKIL